MEIIYTPRFIRRYKKLPREAREAARRNEKIFRTDPFSPSLKTHKLSGGLKNFWSFSIDYRYRIIFEFSTQEDVVYFHTVGTHDIYK